MQWARFGNPFKKKMVQEAVLPFLRVSDTNVWGAYSILFPVLWVHTTEDVLIIFLFSK